MKSCSLEKRFIAVSRPNRVPAALTPLVLGLALVGCATIRTASDERPAASSEMLRAAAQWREPTGSDVRVAEVFFANPSAAPVAIETLRLAGKPLPLPSGSTPKEGDGPMWWRVRPSPTLPPGGGAVATIAYAEGPRQALDLECIAGGLTNRVTIPRFASPPRLVTSVVFPAGDAIAVQTASGTVSPVALSVNGIPRPFRRLRDGRRGLPDVLVARMPSPIRTGDDVFLRVGFADGTSRHAAVRALTTFPVDVPLASDAEKKSIGVGRNVGVFGISPDVGCIDLARHRPGAYIPRLLADLDRERRKDASLFHGVHFCSGAVAATFDIYGPVADSALAGSLAFERTAASEARLSLSERDFLKARQAARPSPVFWYAGLFRRNGAAFTPAEADALFWTMIARGNRGVKFHTWRGGRDVDGLAEIPELRNCVKRWTAILRKRDGDLAALVPADEFQSDGLVVRTAWNPLSGMLVVWRTAGLAPAGEGATLRVRRPEWLSPLRAEELADGRRVGFATEGSDLVFALDGEASHGVFWVSAKRPAIP